MKKSIIYIAPILISLIVSACDIPIQLDADQTAPLPVIEGLVTNQENKSYVRITETVDFYHVGKPPVIEDATVFISDNLGSLYQLAPYQGNNEDSLGYYLVPPGFAGVIGRTYTLFVEINGEEYTATEGMFPLSGIDSLAIQADISESLKPGNDGRFYEVLVFAREPEETKDYYLFKFYRNDTLERAFDDDIYIVDDIFLAVNISGVPVPFFYAEGDTAVVEMYGISNTAFTYYSDLQIVLNNDGGLFSPPPANPRTNFDKNTPGYFLVAAVAIDSIVVE